jgi:hypothetical protein
MKKCQSLIVLLTLFAAIFPARADQETEIKFPGDSILRTKIDEMTDKLVCSIETPNLFSVFGSRLLVFEVPHGEYIQFRSSAMVRIESDPPINLNIDTDSNAIIVPQRHFMTVLSALYLGKKVVLRYYTSKYQHNDVIVPGDFWLAYDHAIKTCNWTQLSVRRPPPKRGPSPEKNELGIKVISFGSSIGWSLGWVLRVDEELKYCWVTAAEENASSKLQLHLVRGGKHDPMAIPLEDLYLVFFNAERETVGSLGPLKAFTHLVLEEVTSIAKKAGELGYIGFQSGLGFKNVSLFGLLDAIAYGEKRCLAISR